MSLETTPPGIALQERDVGLLRGLYESRLMTLAHVASLYFDGRLEAAKKRLQRLKSVELIGERPRRPYEPSVLFLTRAGFALLQARGALADYPSVASQSFEKRSQVKELTLRHELAVMDVKAAIVAAVNAPVGNAVEEFCTWPLLYQFEADQPHGVMVMVKPDGFIRIRQEDPEGGLFEHTFFLEVDRSTETQETLALKAACYRDYYRRGGLAVKHGRARSEYEAFPFRVLMVFKNAERRNNAAARLLLLNPPILTQTWLTTFAEVTDRPLEAIWVRPIDFRNAVKGTRFEVGHTEAPSTYRRQTEREALVETTVAKHALLAADDVTGE